MNREDIIQMAQECHLIGMRPHLDGIYQESLERFAALVAAHVRETEFKPERSKDSETPALDVQSTMEMCIRAYESKCFELESAELEVKRLRALVEHTYYINDAGNLCQRLMDNLTADMARDILESLK